MNKLSRAVRVLEYEGPPDWVEEQLRRRQIQGEVIIAPGTVIRESVVWSNLFIFPVPVERTDDASARIHFLLSNYDLWSKEGTFTFPDGETWEKQKNV